MTNAQAAPYLFAVPFAICTGAGWIGGWWGLIVFVLMIVPTIFLAFIVFGTGAPFDQGWWSLVPPAGAASGVGTGFLLHKILGF